MAYIFRRRDAWTRLLAGCAPLCLVAGVAAQAPVGASQTPAAKMEARDQSFLLRRGLGVALPGTGQTRGPLHSAPISAAALRAARARAVALLAGSPASALRIARTGLSQPETLSSNTTTWQAFGPSQLDTPAYGLVTGRVSSLAVDPSDPSGNTVYLGATGGGVWKSTNAAGNAASVTFAPLTDDLSFFANSFVSIPSLSIGAISVDPGNPNVLLAGTGDPNDALDSYYGVGILRSADGGATWSLIAQSSDGFVSGRNYSFEGVGFAGFAWSSTTPNLVVAAASQSLEGLLVNTQFPATAESGLYYSTDAGVTWHLATVEDGANFIFQSTNPPTAPPGTPATSVVWNARRGIFLAAVRFHGYYSSPDGVTWTRLANQPGAGLSAQNCPADPAGQGSTSCPVFRGVLSVQPVTGDTFALTTDLNNRDQGLYRDVCSTSGSTSGGCTSSTMTFAARLNDSALDDPQNPGVIDQADYNLSLAAVASQQDTVLFAGTQDIYRCSLANSCTWRNTTNNQTCDAAQVAPSTHAIDGTFGVNGLVYFGNDGGLWRTTDTLAQTGSVCASTDASHFQNLNGGIGSLAEVNHLAVSPSNPALVLAGMNGFGVVASESVAAQGATGAWQQIATGEGDYVAIDPVTPTNWYAGLGTGLSLFACPDGGNCDSGSFGSTPVIDRGDIEDDADYFLDPAPWMLDPGNASNVLVGTCRMWMGPVSGDWSAANLLSGMLDNDGGPFCDGNAALRSVGAGGSYNSPQGGEQMYAGMAGPLDGGGSVPGHLYGATVPQSGGKVTWADLWRNPVTNAPLNSQFNSGGYAISSIAVDPHDTTGKTIYVGIAGFASLQSGVLYSSTDGGAHWTNITNSLPAAPVSRVVVDPANKNDVYVAGDFGVYQATNIANCASNTQNCWSVLGAGLPNAPVTDLQVVHSGATNVLEASTYGRGIWTIGLATTASAATATLTPTSYSFAALARGTRSATAAFRLSNTGAVPLTVSSIATAPTDYAETNNCGASLSAGGGCTIQVSFTPQAVGDRPGTLTVHASTTAGVLTAALDGTGLTPGSLTLSPASLSFPTTPTGASSPAQTVTLQNPGAVALPLGSISIAGANPGDFALGAGSTCGSSLAASASCTVPVVFHPVLTGSRAAQLQVVASATGSPFSIGLSGTAVQPAFLLAAPTPIGFASTPEFGTSAQQTITITNTGGAPAQLGVASIVGDYLLSNNTCGVVLNPGTACSVAVAFQPQATGSRAGLFTLPSTSIPAGQVTVALSGTGLPPSALSLSPSPLSFGAQQQGATSPPLTMTVTNTAGSAALLGAPSVSAAFAITADNCPASLATGATCSIAVTFTPTQLIAYNGTLTLPYNNGLSISAPMTGNGAGAPFLNLGISTLAFPATAQNSASAPLSVTVVNAGGSPATLSSIAASTNFAVTASTCPVAPQTLAPNANCSLSLVFTPPGTATYAGTLTLSGTFSNSPLTLPLSGQGATLPAGSLTPSALTFPDTPQGSASPAQSLTLTSTGGVALVLGSPSVTNGYQIAGNTCPASLAPGNSCALSVLFHPGATGPIPGTLTISSNAPYVPSAALAGNGLAMGVITLTPSTLQFGNVNIASSSTVQSVNVTNTGGSSISLGAPSATGDYAIAATTCTATLAPAQACSVSLVFQPTSAGARPGQLIVPGGAGSPAVATLQGTGVIPGSISLSPSPEAFGLVATGSSLSLTLTATNPGATAVHLTSLATTGDFAVTGGTCNPTISLAANGGNCTVIVTFTPEATGTRSGTLTLSGNGSGSGVQVIAPLAGVGVLPATLTLAPDLVSFGNVASSTVSATQTVTATNSGGLPATLGTPTINAAQFSVSGNTCGATLAAGAQCTLQVAFSPTEQGPLHGVLTYPGQYADSPSAIQLAGTGTKPLQVTLSSAALDFGSVAVGATAAQTLAVSNTGGGPVTLGTPSVSTNFSVTSNCPASLDTGANCTLTISVTPQGVGALSGLLTLPNSTAAGTETVALTAQGVLPGALAVTPSTLTFAATGVGAMSSAQSVTFQNVGGAALPLRSVKLSTADYALQSSTCGISLATGGSCTVSVVFTPGDTGDRSATLTLAGSGTSTAKAVVSLDGNGLAPAHLLMVPASLQFGSQTERATSPAQSITLSNSGGIAAALALPVLSGQYKLAANTCSATLEGGASCVLSVVFAPTSNGSQTGSLSVTGTPSAGGDPTSATAALHGTGMALALTPTAIAFEPAMAIGHPSGQVLIAVQNLDTSPIALQAPTIVGDFAITASSCGASLAPDSSCAYGVTFTPTASGTRTGLFTLSDGAESATTQLSGQGLSGASDTLSPSGLIFSATTIGTSSAPLSLTLTNSGEATLQGISVHTGGPFAASNNCGNSLGGHLSCEIAVTFTPPGEGALNGTITVADAIRTQTVSLSGVGALSTAASASPVSLDFGPYVLHGVAPAQVVTLNNPGTAPLTALAPSITGDDFTISKSSCGSTLAPASSCQLTILFTPSAPGLREGVLSITDAPTAAPLSVNLSGSGEDFALSVSGSSSSVITSGQTATFSILATPAGTSAGTLTVTCTGAPAQSLCTPNPATLNIAAGSVGDITLSLRTGIGASALLTPQQRAPLSRSGLPEGGWAAGAAFALLMPMWFLGASGRRRFLLVLVTAAVLGSSAACGVHSSGATGGGGTTLAGETPKGTYTLTITAAFPGAQRQTTVQVIVQ